MRLEKRALSLNAVDGALLRLLTCNEGECGDSPIDLALGQQAQPDDDSQLAQRVHVCSAGRRLLLLRLQETLQCLRGRLLSSALVVLLQLQPRFGQPGLREAPRCCQVPPLKNLPSHARRNQHLTHPFCDNGQLCQDQIAVHAQD